VRENDEDEGDEFDPGGCALGLGVDNLEAQEL